MDPIAVLQNRIEQLEAKLGLAANAPVPPASPGGNVPPNQGQQGDGMVANNVMNATANLLQAAETMQNATAGHEKLHQAMNMASELNNYTDPNHMQNVQHNQMHMQEVAAAEPMIRQYCQCMNHCQQAAPVLDSEPIQQVPQMQAQVDQMQRAAAEAKGQADQAFQGVQELAQNVGAAAQEASEQIADMAQKVEQVEEKKFPKRRNGLD